VIPTSGGKVPQLVVIFDPPLHNFPADRSLRSVLEVIAIGIDTVVTLVIGAMTLVMALIALMVKLIELSRK
jgi:hypothetical protein